MEVGFGDIANRIVTVGDVSRAEIIAGFLDKDTNAPVKTIRSGRGFTTFTGKYNSIDVSIVAIGMGPAMMDFFVRESRAVVSGPMAMVRFGTCGGLTSVAKEGRIVVASGGSGYITRNPDAFVHNYDNDHTHNSSDIHLKPYKTHQVVPADKILSALVVNSLTAALGSEGVAEGTNVTAESFYSSQGRADENFDDNNAGIFDTIRTAYPTATTLEMETFMLLHLARCSKIPIMAAAAAIVKNNRLTRQRINGEELEKLEAIGGRAILEAITMFEL